MPVTTLIWRSARPGDPVWTTRGEKFDLLKLQWGPPRARFMVHAYPTEDKQIPLVRNNKKQQKWKSIARTATPLCLSISRPKCGLPAIQQVATCLLFSFKLVVADRVFRELLGDFVNFYLVDYPSLNGFHLSLLVAWAKVRWSLLFHITV